LKALSKYQSDSNYGLSSNFDRSVWHNLKALNFYLLDADVALIIKTLYATPGQDGTEWSTWAVSNAEESVGYFGSPFSLFAEEVFGYGSTEHLQKLGVRNEHALQAGKMPVGTVSAPSVVNFVPATPDKANK